MLSTKIYLTISMFYFSLFIFSCKSNNVESKNQDSTIIQKKVTSFENNRPGFYMNASAGNWTKNIDTNSYYKYHLPVKTNLINNTSDTIYYLSWSCSWFFTYTIDNKNLFIENWDCDKNSDEIFAIPPYSTEEEKTLNIVTKKDYKKTVGLKFRIGLKFTHVTGQDYHYKISLISKPTIIWSDTLTIK